MGIRIPDNIAALKPYPPGKPLEELEREFRFQINGCYLSHFIKRVAKILPGTFADINEIQGFNIKGINFGIFYVTVLQSLQKPSQ